VLCSINAPTDVNFVWGFLNFLPAIVVLIVKQSIDYLSRAPPVDMCYILLAALQSIGFRFRISL